MSRATTLTGGTATDGRTVDIREEFSTVPRDVGTTEGKELTLLGPEAVRTVGRPSRRSTGEHPSMGVGSVPKDSGVAPGDGSCDTVLERDEAERVTTPTGGSTEVISAGNCGSKLKARAQVSRGASSL
jgi:hypothetical protein